VLTLLKRIFFDCDILLIEALDKLFVGAEALLETVFGIYV
jgi:alpha-N-acetylglucosamine transferase